MYSCGQPLLFTSVLRFTSIVYIFIAEYYSIVFHNIFFFSDGHLGTLQFWVISNTSAANIVGQVFLWT